MLFLFHFISFSPSCFCYKYQFMCGEESMHCFCACTSNPTAALQLSADCSRIWDSFRIMHRFFFLAKRGESIRASKRVHWGVLWESLSVHRGANREPEMYSARSAQQWATSYFTDLLFEEMGGVKYWLLHRAAFTLLGSTGVASF